jgi:hypothetical protein
MKTTKEKMSPLYQQQQQQQPAKGWQLEKVIENSTELIEVGSGKERN